MTSPAKPEIHKEFERRQRRTEPRPEATCTKMAKFDHAVFELCERTDRQTDRHAHHNTIHPSGGGRSNKAMVHRRLRPLRERLV